MPYCITLPLQSFYFISFSSQRGSGLKETTYILHSRKGLLGNIVSRVQCTHSDMGVSERDYNDVAICCVCNSKLAEDFDHGKSSCVIRTWDGGRNFVDFYFNIDFFFIQICVKNLIPFLYKIRPFLLWINFHFDQQEFSTHFHNKTRFFYFHK